jgi:sodium transport system permease protein
VRAIFTVFKKEFRENLRDRRTLFTALIFGPLFSPLLFAGVLGLMIQRGDVRNDQPLTIAVSHTERAPNLVNHLIEYGVTVEPVKLDDEGARKAIQKQEHRLVLMIPEIYGEKLAATKPAPLELYSDSSEQMAERDARRAKGIIGAYGAGITQLRMMARGLDPTMLVPIAVHDVDVATPASRSVLALGTMSYIILLTMLMGGLYLAIDDTAGERERGSLLRKDPCGLCLHVAFARAQRDRAVDRAAIHRARELRHEREFRATHGAEGHSVQPATGAAGSFAHDNRGCVHTQLS